MLLCTQDASLKETKPCGYCCIYCSELECEQRCPNVPQGLTTKEEAENYIVDKIDCMFAYEK